MPTKLSHWCDKVIRAGGLLSLVLVPLFFNPYAEQPGRIFEGSRAFLLRSLTLIMLLAWLVKLVESGEIKKTLAQYFPRQPLILLTAGLGIVYLVATFLSPCFPVSFWGFYLRDEGFYTFLSYLIIFFLMAPAIKKEGFLDLAVTSVIIVSIPISLYGIFQHFGQDTLHSAEQVRDRVPSTLGGPIFLGAYLALLIPLTLGRLIQFRRSIPQLGAYGAVLFIQLAALYFTRSRGPQVACLVGLIFFALIAALRWRIRWLFVSVSLLVMLGIVFLLGPQIPNSPLAGLRKHLGRFDLQSGESAATIQVRVAIWKTAEETLKAQPARLLTGYGLESIPTLYRKHYNMDIARYEGAENTPDHSHNDTFDLLVTVGIPGLLLFLGIIMAAAGAVGRYLGLITQRRDWLTPLEMKAKDGLKQSKVTSSSLTGLTFYLCLIGGMGLSMGLTPIVAQMFSLGDGFPLFGLAIPAGLVVGLGVYLVLNFFWFNRASTNPPLPARPNDILLIALLCGVIAHFVEIQSGMGLTTTRLYLWGFLALIAGLASEPPSTETKPAEQSSPVNTTLIYSLLTGLIISVVAFCLIRQNLRSDVVGYLVLLIGSPAIIGGFLVLPQIRLAERWLSVVFSYLLYLVLSIGWGGLFIGLYSSLLGPQTELSTYLTLLYVWLGLTLVVLMVLIPATRAMTAGLVKSGAPMLTSVAPRIQRHRGGHLMIYLILGVVTLVFVYQTNLKLTYAETLYKKGIEAERFRPPQWDTAIAYFSQCITATPQTGYYYEALDDAYIHKGDYEKSVATLAEAWRVNPSDTRLLPQLALRTYDWAAQTPPGPERAQRLQQALDYYRLLTTEYAPTIPTYRQQLINTAEKLCEYYYNQKQYPEFLKVNEIMIKNDPTNYRHHYYAARAYHSLGKKAEALKEAEIGRQLANPKEKPEMENLIKELIQ